MAHRGGPSHHHDALWLSPPSRWLLVVVLIKDSSVVVAMSAMFTMVFHRLYRLYVGIHVVYLMMEASHVTYNL